jgi:exonuclease III
VEGGAVFSHGSEHSRGVLTLVKEGLDCELKVCKQDELGRYIILKGFVQGQPFIVANIYAPNKVNEQCVFYDEIQNELAKLEADADHQIIIGGDFNVILDPDLDRSGGKPKLKESSKNIENLCSSFDLIDIWRIRNPIVKRFSWRQKNPAIQRRLDYWLITNSIQEEVEKVDIIPAIRSDHSAITLHVNGIENTTYGPSIW